MKKTETKSTVLLSHHLKSLKMPTMLAECEKVAGRCAADNVDHLGFLLQLCELELLERERKAAARRLKAWPLPRRWIPGKPDSRATLAISSVVTGSIV